MAVGIKGEKYKKQWGKLLYILSRQGTLKAGFVRARRGKLGHEHAAKCDKKKKLPIFVQAVGKIDRIVQEGVKSSNLTNVSRKYQTN